MTFADFAVSMLQLVRPADTRIVWTKGMDVTAQFNELVERMSGDWLWILGHDHTWTWDPLILVKLLQHDLDVVVPLVLKKNAPFDIVVYSGEVEDENGKSWYMHAELEPEGVQEVYAAGSAGMLIRRRVLDKLERPIFRTTGFQQDEDLQLCAAIRNAGFKIHIDVDTRMGHLGFFPVYPMWQGNGFGPVLDLGGGQITPLWKYNPDAEPIGGADGEDHPA